LEAVAASKKEAAADKAREAAAATPLIILDD
jgi:hypothetical protein